VTAAVRPKPQLFAQVVGVFVGVSVNAPAEQRTKSMICRES
jgi:hypothetical protein